MRNGIVHVRVCMCVRVYKRDKRDRENKKKKMMKELDWEWVIKDVIISCVRVCYIEIKLNQSTSKL